MDTLKCKVKGCTSVFQSEVPLAANAEFTCREHTPKGKQNIHFQRTQFDKQLRNGRSPVGTNHIKNQGSQIYVAGESVLTGSNE